MIGPSFLAGEITSQCRGSRPHSVKANLNKLPEFVWVPGFFTYAIKMNKCSNLPTFQGAIQGEEQPSITINIFSNNVLFGLQGGRCSLTKAAQTEAAYSRS